MKKTFQSFLSLVLVFIMTFSTGVVPAVFADDTTVTESVTDTADTTSTPDIRSGGTSVAKIGNTEYATIDEAIANWTNGTTLTLLADVTLTGVISLSSTEYHILDLGTYTMTAASGKDAIQIVNNGRSSASYALDIKADATAPGGITATGKAIVRTSGKSGVKDRPIIRFYNGVFNATNIVYHSGSNGTNCPQFQFHGGEFNGTVYTNRALNQFYGGTFNGSLQMSVDSSAYTLISGGTFKQLSNLYMSSLNSDKFTIGSGKGTYNREVYVNDAGYYVVAAAEPAEGIEAAVAKTPTTNDYLKYSKVGTEGKLNYTDVYVALEKNTSATITVYTDSLDLTGSKFKGTIVLPEGNNLVVTFADGTTPAWTMVPEADGKEITYTESVGNGVVTRSYKVSDPPVAEISDVKFASIQEAVDAAADGDTVKLLTDITLTDEDIVKVGNYGVMVNVDGKAITLDLNGKKITVDYKGGQYLYAVILVADGAELTVTGDGEIDVPQNGENVAYMFWKRGTAGALTIENGTYHMDDTADSMVYTNGNEIVTVAGGTFVLDSVGTGTNGSPWIFNAQGTGGKSIIITGGTFSADINRQHWSDEAVVAKDRYVVKDNGYWTVKEGAAAYVKEGMLTGPYYAPKDVGYATFEEAVAAANAKNDSSVTLLKDAYVTGDVVGEGLDVICGEYRIILADAAATLTASDGLNVITNVDGCEVVYVDGVYKVAAINYVAKIGDQFFLSVSAALDAAYNAGMKDVVITLIGDTDANTTDSVDLYNKYGNGTAFNTITFRQEDASKPYYLQDLYTGWTTGKVTFDGVNIVVTSQLYAIGKVELINNSTITRTNDIANFVFYGDMVIEPGSKLVSQVDRISSGSSLTVDGGRTDGAYNTTADYKTVWLYVEDGNTMTIKNGAYVVVSNYEYAELEVSGTVNVQDSKLDAFTAIRIGANGVFNVDADSAINTKSIIGSGKIVIDAAGMSEGVVEAFKNVNLSGFTGTVELANVAAGLKAEIVDGVLYLKSTIVGGTWGGIDWTLTEDGTLTIAPTKGTPVADPNSGKTYEVGAWREAVRYDSKGEGVAIEGWPYDRTKVKTLIIEEGVTSIGSFTAQGFTNLTGEVVIPSTVTYIGQEAFQKSTFTKLTFAAGGTEELCIAQGAFKNLIIEEVVLPADRPVHLHAWVFNNCLDLKHATLPATLVSVHGTNHIDYFKDFNAHSNPTWTKSSEIFAYDENLATITFGSEAVRDMFFANNNGTSKDSIVAYIGLVAYSSLKDAVNAAQDGDTITLIKNVVLDCTEYTDTTDGYVLLFVTGKTITVDLNGKKISTTANMSVTLDGIFGTMNGGHLTIVDSSAAQTGSVEINAVTNVYALMVNYGKDSTIQIDAGSYSLNTASNSLIFAYKDGPITVNGGNFYLGNVATGENGSPWIFNVSGQNVHAITVNGGTFNDNVADQYWAFEAQLGENKAMKDNGDGTWTVVEAVVSVTDKIWVYPDYNWRERTLAYVTLEEAVAAANEASKTYEGTDIDGESVKVTLIKDTECDATLKVTGNITLDLNGKTVTGTDNASGNFALIEVQPGAELTVNDTVDTGAITLIATNNRGWNAYSSVISNQRGKLTVNGGTIEHLGGTDMAYGIDNLTNGKDTYAETVINGGTIKSTYRAIRQFLNGVEAQNILTVNGGTIEGTNKSIWMQDPSKNANSGTLMVAADATLKGDVYLFVTEGSTEWPVEISIAAAALNGESTVVTGNIPAGYAVVKTNGIYGVVKKPVVAMIGDVKYYSFDEALEAAVKDDVITVFQTIVLDEDGTLDLKGARVNADVSIRNAPVFRVLADVTVTNGIVDGGSGINCYAFIVGNNDTAGALNIADGTYRGVTSAISITNGVANISGGTFQTKHDDEGTDYGTTYLLNCVDDAYKNGTAKFNITGGTFKGFNPADNAAEGAGTNFVAEGYAVNANLNTSDNIYRYVVVKPNVEMDGKYYATIKDALGTLASADTTVHTVKVLEDLEIDVNYSTYNYPILVNGFSVVLDLNGKTVTADWSKYTGTRVDNALIGVCNGGKLTMTDSVGDGKIVNNDTNPNVENRIFWIMTGTATKGIEVIIEGGSYIQNDENTALLYVQGNKPSDNLAPVSVSIIGGHFETVDEDFFNAYDGFQHTSTISGGTFNKNPTDWEIKIAENFEAKEQADGTYEVRPAPLATVEVETTSGTLNTIVVTIENWGDLVAALGDTTNVPVKVTLTHDINLAETLVIAGDKTVDLDLNGHILQMKAVTDGVPTHVISNTATLTVKDTVGTGVIITNDCDTNDAGNKTKNGFAISVTAGGTLVVDGAKIVGTNWGYALYVVDAGTSVTLNDAVVEGRGALYLDGGALGTVNDGTYTMTVTTTNNQDNVVYVGGSSELTVNGGTFTTGDVTGEQRLAIAAIGTSKVTINDGTFYGLTGDVQTKNTASVSITGGTFTGTKMDERVTDSIAITGGTFSYDPTDWTARGYGAQDNGNGTWTVVMVYAVELLDANGDRVEIYETVNDAVDAAIAGQTVKLLADDVTTGLVIRADITVDLAGYNLTADYVVAFRGAAVIDSNSAVTGAELGSLIAPKDLVRLDGDNGNYFPVWDGTAYKFGDTLVTSGDNNGIDATGAIGYSFRYDFTGQRNDLEKLLTQDETALIKVKLTWTTSDGKISDQSFTLPNEMAEYMLVPGNTARLTVTGLNGIENINICVILESTGAKVSIEGGSFAVSTAN